MTQCHLRLYHALPKFKVNRVMDWITICNFERALASRVFDRGVVGILTSWKNQILGIRVILYLSIIDFLNCISLITLACE